MSNPSNFFDDAAEMSGSGHSDDESISSENDEDRAMINDSSETEDEGFSHASLHANFEAMDDEVENELFSFAHNIDNARNRLRKARNMEERPSNEDEIANAIAAEERLRVAHENLNESTRSFRNNQPQGMRVSRNPCPGFSSEYPMTSDSVAFNILSSDMEAKPVHISDIDTSARGNALRYLLFIFIRACEIVCTPPPGKVVKAAPAFSDNSAAPAKAVAKDVAKDAPKVTKRKPKPLKPQAQPAQHLPASGKTKRKANEDTSVFSTSDDEDDAVPCAEPDSAAKEITEAIAKEIEAQLDEVAGARRKVIMDDDEEISEAASQASRAIEETPSEHDQPEEGVTSRAPSVASGSEDVDEDDDVVISDATEKQEDEGKKTDDKEQRSAYVPEPQAPNSWTFFVPGKNTAGSEDCWVPKLTFVAEVLLNKHWSIAGVRYILLSHQEGLDLNEVIGRVIDENAELMAEQNKRKNSGKAPMKGICNSRDHTCHRVIESPFLFYQNILCRVYPDLNFKLERARTRNLPFSSRENDLRPTVTLSFENACNDPRLAEKGVLDDQCDYLRYKAARKGVLADNFIVDGDDDDNAEAIADVPVRVFPVPAATFVIPIDLVRGSQFEKQVFWRSPCLERAMMHRRPDGSSPIVGRALDDEELEKELFGDNDINPSFLGIEKDVTELNSTENIIKNRNLIDMLAERNQARADEIEAMYLTDPNTPVDEKEKFYLSAIANALEEFDKPSSVPLMAESFVAVRKFVKVCEKKNIWFEWPTFFKDSEFRMTDQFEFMLMQVVSCVFNIRPGKMQRDTLIIYLTAMNASRHTMGITISTINHGKHSAGKSEMTKIVMQMMVPGTYNLMSAISEHGWEVDHDIDYVYWVWEEAQAEKFGIDPRTGMTMPGGSEVLKMKQTEKMVLTYACQYEPDPRAKPDSGKKRRVQRKSVSRQMGAMSVNFNFEIPASSTGSEDDAAAIWVRYIQIAASQSYKTEVGALDAAIQSLIEGTNPANNHAIHMFRMLHAICFHVEMLIGAKAIPDVTQTLALYYLRDLNREMVKSGRQGISPRQGLMFIGACRELAILSAGWKWMMSEFSVANRFMANGTQETRLTPEIFLDISQSLFVTDSHISFAATLLEDVLDPITRTSILETCAFFIKNRKPKFLDETPASYHGPSEKVVNYNYLVVTSMGLENLAKMIETHNGVENMPMNKVKRELQSMFRSTCPRWIGGANAEQINVLRASAPPSAGIRGGRSIISVATSQLLQFLPPNYLENALNAANGVDCAVMDDEDSSAVEKSEVWKALQYHAKLIIAAGTSNNATSKELADYIESFEEGLEKVMTPNTEHATEQNELCESLNMLKDFTTQYKRIDQNMTVVFALKWAKFLNVNHSKANASAIMKSADNLYALKKKMQFGNSMERLKDEKEAQQLVINVGRGAINPERIFERNTFIVRHLRDYFSHHNAAPHILIDAGPLAVPRMDMQRLCSIIRVGPKENDFRLLSSPVVSSVVSQLILHNITSKFGDGATHAVKRDILLDADTADAMYYMHLHKSRLVPNRMALPSNESQYREKILELHTKVYTNMYTKEKYPESALESEMQYVRQIECVRDTQVLLKTGSITKDSEDAKPLMNTQKTKSLVRKLGELAFEKADPRISNIDATYQRRKLTGMEDLLEFEQEVSLRPRKRLKALIPAQNKA